MQKNLFSYEYFSKRLTSFGINCFLSSYAAIATAYTMIKRYEQNQKLKESSLVATLYKLLIAQVVINLLSLFGSIGLVVVYYVSK